MNNVRKFFCTCKKTKIIGQVGIAQTFLDVDSTLGFPKSGTLSFLYKNGTTEIALMLIKL